MSLPAQPGRLYLIDTSAHARINHHPVRDVIASLIADHAAATCVTVDLEAGYSGRDETDVRALASRRRSHYVPLPINETIAECARDVQISMAARGHHRAAAWSTCSPPPWRSSTARSCCITTPTSELIAATTGQSQTWVAPHGSIS